ncbi:MAG: hypothetical protein WC824_13110, partial [Bacteroidota bacterium]
YGMLQLNPETAPSLGGPYPGGFAAFVLRDCRVDWMGRDVEPVTSKNDRYLSDHPEIVLVDFPTSAKPFELHIAGNDDASWSAYYATEKEAMDILELLEAGQPLDLYEDVISLGFMFTN